MLDLVFGAFISVSMALLERGTALSSPGGSPTFGRSALNSGPRVTATSTSLNIQGAVGLICRTEARGFRFEAIRVFFVRHKKKVSFQK